MGRSRSPKRFAWNLLSAVAYSVAMKNLSTIREELGVAPAIADPSVVIKWATEPLFIANVVSAYLSRKYGFPAPLVMRFSFYLVWHIIYGGLIAS